MIYTTEKAVNTAAFLEPHFASHGMHIAVGGSCIYAGVSTKDIDIFVYPHKSEPIDKAEVVKIIESLGYKSFYGEGFHYQDNEHYPFPDVLVSKHEVSGKRVDFFILHRPN